MPTITLSSSNYNGQTANITLFGSNAIIYNIGSHTIPYIYDAPFIWGTYVLVFPDTTECEIIVPPPCEILYIENYTGQTNGARMRYDSNNGDVYLYFNGSLENINYGDTIYITPSDNSGTLYYNPPIEGIYDLTFISSLGTTYLDFSSFYSLIDIEITNNNSISDILNLYSFYSPFITGITISNCTSLYNLNYNYISYFSNLQKVDFSFLPQISSIDLSYNNISDINISGTPLNYLLLYNNNLSVNSQNHILKSLYENGVPNGYLDMSYQLNNLCPNINDPEIYNYLTGLTNNLFWTIYYGPVCNNFPTPTPTSTPLPTPTPTATPIPPPPFEFGQPEFISYWQTTTPNETITLPLYNTNTYNFNVNWGDGNNDNITSYNQPEVTHTYITPGTYVVTISGTCEGWSFASNPSKTKIKDILQWGNFKFTMGGGTQFNTRYFDGCTGLTGITANDVPDFTNTSSLYRMFYNCSSLTSITKINDWDVSNIGYMINMFAYASQFNQNIGNWNVSNVGYMDGMFASATSFNNGGSPSISGWNVGNVSIMFAMFQSATSFNQPIGNWNVSGVTNMYSLFYSAVTFNQPLSGWNVGNVTSMEFMFGFASSFNQNIGNWNVGKVTNISNMFRKSTSFNNGGIPSISGWNVGNVTSMISTFQESTSFNQPIGNWNVSGVTNMTQMFYSAVTFNQDIGNWNVGNVTQMGYLFNDAKLFNNGGSPSISGWNVSKVTSMSHMFENNTSFNQPIGNWNVSKVTSMSHMFKGSTSFNQPIGSWNVSGVTDMSLMFNYTYFNQNIGNWDVSNVTNMFGMFYSSFLFNNGGSPSISGWNVSKVTFMNLMFWSSPFNQPIGNWNVSGVTFMNGMFNQSNFNQPLSGWNVSNVTEMSLMFGSNTSFNQPIGNWNVSKVTSMDSMFANSTSFNQDISDWIITGFTDNNSLRDFMYNKSSINYNSLYYDNMLQKWSSLPNLLTGVTWNMGTIKYNSSAQVYKNTLTGSPINWVITDGGQV